jgi:hypothetical protein
MSPKKNNGKGRRVLGISIFAVYQESLYNQRNLSLLMTDIAAASLTDVVLTKQCCICQKELPVAMFYRATRNKDGLQGVCKSCSAQSSKKSVQKHPIRSQTNKMVVKARQRARKKQLDFNINQEYVRSLVVSHCPIFGIPLEWSCYRENSNGTLPNSPSLDRIDPTKGYVKGNLWIISHKANVIKNNATHEELKLVTKAVGEAIVKSLEF